MQDLYRQDRGQKKIWTFKTEKYVSNFFKLWIVFTLFSYDLTPFIDEHPGGSDLLLLANKRDGTTLFEGYHAAANPHRINAKLKELECPMPQSYVHDKNLPTFWYKINIYSTCVGSKKSVFNRVGSKKNFLNCFKYIIIQIPIGLGMFGAFLITNLFLWVKNWKFSCFWSPKPKKKK